MSDAGRAVFLSYASQDAEAARRICDALRAAGVEVWFDQSELRGGDAWDAMIRKRIKECALFVPVISPNTNARPEGYFRLEWKLAVDRSHLMADDAPFLFPIAIGDVNDATARVPDKFREVQWTRLRLDETPAELAARVQRLLREDPVTGARGQVAGERGRETEGKGRAEKRGFEKWWWLIFPIMGMSVPIIGLLRQEARPPAPPSGTAPTEARPAASATSEARQLAERARALSLDKFNSTAADYATAEGLLKRALELDQNDAELWTISSLFNTSIRTRGFDHAPVRRERARRDAERAVALAPDSVNALFALGRSQRDSDRDAAEATFRRILALDPNHAEAMSQVAWICDLTDRFDEALRLYDRVLELNPKSAPLTHYIRHLLFFHYGRFAEAEAESRKSVALDPSANAVTGEAIVALTWRGDAEAAARALAAAPTPVQGSPRMIWVGALVHLARRDPDETLRTLQRTEEVYLQDNWFAGPKAMFAGLAHRQAGRPEAARVAWEAALTIVDERLRAAPQNEDLHLARGQLLAWLGRPEEARREARTLQELASGRKDPIWVYSPALIHAALGDVDAAVPLLEELLAWNTRKNSGWPLTAALLRTDYRWDALRSDPRFQELLVRAEAARLAGMPPRDWPKDPELKKAMSLLDRLDAIPDDFRLAEEIAQRVLDRAPTDPEAVTAMARVQSMWLLRGWDRSSDRQLKAKRITERAVQLAPDEPEALAALGLYLNERSAERSRGRQLLERAVQLAPAEPRFHRWRNELVWQDETIPRDEVFAAVERTAALFPHDALSRYDVSRHYRVRGRLEDSDRAIDATLAIAPVANAMVWKARNEFALRGDLAGMKSWLDAVPVRVRGIERTVFGYFIYAVMSGDYAVGVTALSDMAEPWMIDFDYRGPKALPLASLLELQDKPGLARIQYEIALRELQRRQSDDSFLKLVEAWTLHGLGRDDEARTALRTYNESIERPYRISLLSSWWFQPIACNLVLGEQAAALALMREAAETKGGRNALRRFFALDPRMAPFRDDPEIKGLLAEPPPSTEP